MTKIVLRTIIETEVDTVTHSSRVLRQWTTKEGAPKRKKKIKKQPITLTTGKETKREI